MFGKSLGSNQDRRKLLSDARAAPPVLSGTIISSSTVTSESSTWYSSILRWSSDGSIIARIVPEVNWVYVRKRFITSTSETVRPHGEGWLDLERAAVVEVTSEEEDFPVESALVWGETRGWRAALPGTQTIRLEGILGS
jgi:hypothetical protein